MQVQEERLSAANQKGFEQAITEFESSVRQWQRRYPHPVQPYQGVPRHGSAGQSGFANNSEPLVPPKPKEFEMTQSIERSCAVLGT